VSEPRVVLICRISRYARPFHSVELARRFCLANFASCPGPHSILRDGEEIEVIEREERG
jgi:hypothetical protein